MMGDVDAEGDMRRLVGIIDSMTPDERRNPEDHRPEPPPPHRRRGRASSRTRSTNWSSSSTAWRR